jgi:methylenetetrahydrofolate--tRNA-(uracil-5-)-methyltransferase
MAMACRTMQELAKDSASREAFLPPPRTTALGSLVHYITHADPDNYQPANVSFDLLPPSEGSQKNVARGRRARREWQCKRALTDLKQWLETAGSLPSTHGKPLTTDSVYG